MRGGPYSANPIPGHLLTKKQRDAFLAKVVKTECCWVWTGSTTGHPTHPYGRFRIGKKTYPAHRVAWFLHTGDQIEDGLVIDHECDVTRCVRPDHLRVVTQSENLYASYDRGRR